MRDVISAEWENVSPVWRRAQDVPIRESILDRCWLSRQHSNRRESGQSHHVFYRTAAQEMHLLGEDVCQIMGIPLSASGKSPFFDR